ncbi:MAG: HPP family protein [Planctomycetaceae bacterium]
MPDDRHVFAKPLTKLARDIEESFFRIERENRLLSALFNGVIAGASVALVAWMVQGLEAGDVLLFACLGSSAAAVVFAPLAKTNSLRSIVTAYVIAAVVCIALTPIHQNAWLPIPLQCAMAVAIPVVLMRLTDAVHPAAIGSALAFIIQDRPLRDLSMLMLAILGLLTIVKVLAYVYLQDLEFKKFGYEFRRDYYGREVLVTVEAKKEQPIESTE